MIMWWIVFNDKEVFLNKVIGIDLGGTSIYGGLINEKEKF